MPTINCETGEVTYTNDELEAMAEAEAEALIPLSITPRQFRLLLLERGLFSQVENMISQSTDDVKIAWEYALEFRRDDPILNTFASNLVPPLTEEQINQFFIRAAKL